MKKILSIVLAILCFTSSVCATSFFENSYEFPNNCEILHSKLGYSSCLHLKNGEILLSYSENEYKYTLIDVDGNSNTFTLDYKIIGEDDFSHFIIAKDATVISTEYERFITVEKFGLLNNDFSLLLEPILDNYSIFPEYFVADFDNYGIAKVYYDANYYSMDDTFYTAFDVHTPHDAKQAFLTSNGELITDFDEVYCDFATENRYLVKKDGICSLVDSDMNIIATDFCDIIEIDFGKFVTSSKMSNDSPIYDGSIDQNGESVVYFDFSANDYVSSWAKYYIYFTPYTVSSGFTQTFDDLAQNFYTQNITRIGFCKLIANFLSSKGYDLTEITDFEVFSDTKDNYVLICQKLGIINGTDEENFSPYDNLTREQAATILFRLCEFTNIAADEKADIAHFTDYLQFSDYSREAILSLAKLEAFDGSYVLSGVSEDTFSPQSNITLEQSLIALMRLFYI